MASNHQSFGAPRASQSLRNDRCQNILYKSVFEHFPDFPIASALLLTSKSFQNSSFGANFIINFRVDPDSIGLLESVLAPSTCFSLQFAPSLHITACHSEPINRRIFNFVGEFVNTKYLPASLRSLTLDTATNAVISCFFGISSNAWPQLQELSLTNSEQNDSSLQMMSKNAVQLRKLSFCNNWVSTDASLLLISQLTNITTLELRGCLFITDDGIEHVTKLSELTDLNLRNSYGITDAGMQCVSQLLSITALDVTGCNKVSDVGVEYISRLSNMTSLNVSNCDRITDSGLRSIAKLAGITFLNFSFCYEITDAGLKHVAELSNITSLSLRRCSNVTDAGLHHLVKLSKIISLDITFCNKITLEAEKTFRAALPNCEITDQ